MLLLASCGAARVVCVRPIASSVGKIHVRFEGWLDLIQPDRASPAHAAYILPILPVSMISHARTHCCNWDIMKTQTGHVAHTLNHPVTLLRLRPTRRPRSGYKCAVHAQHKHTQHAPNDICSASTSPRHNHRRATNFAIAQSPHEAWLAQISLNRCVQ